MKTDKNPLETAGQSDADLDALIKSNMIGRLSSKNPLEKIRKNLMIQIVFGFLLCLLYILMICSFRILAVQLALGTVFLFTLWAIRTALQEYKKVDKSVFYNNSLLIELKRIHSSIQRWMHIQQRVALFIYPISATGGFILGGVQGSGKPAGVLMSKPVVLIALTISLLVLVPACYYLTRWLFRYYFGRYLLNLEQNIREIETEK